MLAKRLKQNGQVIHSTTLRGLTTEELEDPQVPKLQERLDQMILAQNVGTRYMAKGYKEDPDIETPQYDSVEENVKQEDVAEVNFVPVVVDQYINEELRDTLQRAHVIDTLIVEDGTLISVTNQTQC